METKMFSDVLASAIAGDSASVEAILAKYMPLINKYSRYGGIPDEDLKQYIIVRFIEQIPRFEVNWKN